MEKQCACHCISGNTFIYGISWAPAPLLRKKSTEHYYIRWLLKLHCCGARGSHEPPYIIVFCATFTQQCRGTSRDTVNNSVSFEKTMSVLFCYRNDYYLRCFVSSRVTAATKSRETLLYTVVAETLLLRCHGISRTTVYNSVPWHFCAAVTRERAEHCK